MIQVHQICYPKNILLFPCLSVSHFVEKTTVAAVYCHLLVPHIGHMRVSCVMIVTSQWNISSGKKSINSKWRFVIQSTLYCIICYYMANKHTHLAARKYLLEIRKRSSKNFRKILMFSCVDDKSSKIIYMCVSKNVCVLIVQYPPHLCIPPRNITKSSSVQLTPGKWCYLGCISCIIITL